MKRIFLLFVCLFVCLCIIFTAGCDENDRTDPAVSTQGKDATVTTAITTATTTASPVTEQPSDNPYSNANPSPEPYTERTPYTLTEVTEPIGTGIGVNAGRVTWVYNKDAFHWNGEGYWWLTSNFDEDAIKRMLEMNLTMLTDKETVKEALDAIFTEFNFRKNGEARAYQQGEIISIKANMNVAGTAEADKVKGYYPSPVMLRTLLTVLVEYGVMPSDIIVYDVSRAFPEYAMDYCSQGILEGVQFCFYDSIAPYDYDAIPNTKAPIVWSYDITQEEYPTYNGYPTCNTAYLPYCVTDADYIINLFNLRGHSMTGITASAKNHFGSFLPGYETENGSISFPTPYREYPPAYAGVHRYVSALQYLQQPYELWDVPRRPMNTYNTLVDLTANADLGAKTVLFICDGLAATVNQSKTLSMNDRWYSYPFGDGTVSTRGWTCSLLVSQDPVAIDSVCYDIILEEKRAAEAIGDKKWSAVLPEGNTAENYLIESALAYNPPSGTYYQDGHGNLVTSLGVHEHWDKNLQYSRNRGEDEGIELVGAFTARIIPQQASSDEILYGTPVIDGVLDDIYLPSFRYVELPLEHVNHAPLGKSKTKELMKNTHGFASYLYDDEYLYVCISVYDETLCSRGDGWRNSTVWPWSDDGAEIYVYFSSENNFAIHSDAHNIRSVRDTHIEPERISAEIYEDTEREDWCAKISEDKKSYVIELRIELPDGVGSGDRIGTLLEINDRFDTTHDNMIGALFVLPRYAGAENFLVTLK